MSIENDGAYDALALPNEALEDGGVEILRAGLIKDELYVTARRLLKDPAQWGDVLAEIARRIALIYSAEDTDLTELEILTQIEQAFAAELGAPIIDSDAPARRKTKSRTSKSKARPAKRKAAKKAAAKKKTARKSAKRKKS